MLEKPASAYQLPERTGIDIAAIAGGISDNRTRVADPHDSRGKRSDFFQPFFRKIFHIKALGGMYTLKLLTQYVQIDTS